MSREKHRCSDPGTPLRLPCMSVTALRVLGMAEQPTTAAGELWRVVHADPAMAVALLSAASGRSPTTREPCDSVRVAIERLGVRAALQVCLGFRLPESRAANGVDLVQHWRYALLTSAYARAIARHLRRADCDLIQTAATLCNLAALMPAAGAAMDCGTCDRWLGKQRVSSRIRALVRASAGSDARLPAECVPTACLRLAARMAEVWLRPDWETTLTQTRRLAQRLFGALPDLCAADLCTWVFGVFGPQARDLEALLQIRVPGPRQTAELYRRANLVRRSGLCSEPCR
jgi:hypothetical protein